MSGRWWLLAARNLGRHRRRTALTGSIVVVGFVATTMTAGFVAQTFSSLGDATVKGTGGHLRLLDPRAVGKTDEEAMGLLLPDWRALADVARKDPAVVDVLPKLSFFGLVVRGEKSAAYLGTGTLPDVERRTTIVADSLAAGEFLSDPEADEVMLGGGLARSLGAGVGDLVTVMATTPDGGLNAFDATVKAVLRYPIKELDDRLLYLPLASASRLLKTDGKASAVGLFLAKGTDLDAAAARIRGSVAASGQPVTVKTWIETAAFYNQVRLLYVAIFTFTGLVLATVVILAVANTMTMSVFERTREIGTLLAIGMERSAVRGLFLKEGLLMGVAGSLLGAVLSLLLRAVLNASGIELPPPPGGTTGNPLYVQLIPGAYLTGFALMTSTLLAASWWPARRASRLDPVEALSHV